MFSRVYVEITNRCNLRCAFCPGTQRVPRDMTVPEFTQIADKLQGVTRYLYLHVMGEPLAHPRLPALLPLAAERGFRTCLTTNGTLLPQRTADLLGADGLHKVSVSLHSFEGSGNGPDLKAYLDGVWEACRALSERDVICVLRLWNEGGLEARNREIEAFFEEATGRPARTWEQPRPQVRKLGNRLFLEGAARFDWPDRDAPERGAEFCHGLRNQIAILCDGTVVPCCLDHEGDLALGNLLKQGLDDILQGRRAQAIYDGFSRRQPVEALCRRCGYAARFNEKQEKR